MRKDIIQKWLEIGQELCTWQKLIDALVGAKEMEIAKRIGNAYGNYQSTVYVYDLFVSLHFTDVKVPKNPSIAFSKKECKVLSFYKTWLLTLNFLFVDGVSSSC